PFGVLAELLPGLLGGLATGEGDQVDELAALAVLLIQGRPEPDQLGAVLLQQLTGMVAEPLVQVVQLALVEVVGPQLEDAPRGLRILAATAAFTSGFLVLARRGLGLRVGASR